MESDRCLSCPQCPVCPVSVCLSVCLSVCKVGVLWPNAGWMDQELMKLGMALGGLGVGGHHTVRLRGYPIIGSGSGFTMNPNPK